MQKEHRWDLVGAESWNDVYKIIQEVVYNYSSIEGEDIVKISKELSGQTIEVVLKLVEGSYRITDA